jgi:LysM repeat protein
MKLSIFKTLLCNILVFAAFTAVLSAQVTTSQSSNETRTPDVAKAQEAVNKLLRDSGVAFRNGLLAYQDNKMADAGQHFNTSVETFLYSNLNVQREPKLSACYNQLVETVFRIEFPADNRLPAVKNLTQTCSWNSFDDLSNIDNALADKITTLAKNSIANTPAAGTTMTVAANGPGTPAPKAGFATQEFEPSPLDELSKLELTPAEQQVDNDPVAQQQYQYIQYAVANKSLGFSFQVHPMIQQFINYYRGRGRGTMEVGLYRSGMFMRMARRIFREEGVPENVAWLGQVESTWKPTALSSAAASGLWQFIPGTGNRFGLERTAYVDERNSFDEATRASARYLKFLADRYHGNWELAMAAYNSGEGNVDRAVRRAGVENFWVAFAYLPQETRNYVPNILATILIANNPNQYGFGQIRPAPSLMYDRVRVPASTNLGLLAQASDTTVQYLRYLNPHLRSNITPPQPYIVNVPAGRAREVVALFHRIPASQINNSNVANSNSGETWQNVANRTGVSIADLMAANPGMPTPKGKVIVPVKGNGVQTIAYTRPTNLPAAPIAGNVRIVKARRGETIATIAERYHADPTEIAKYNGLLPNTVLFAGREIKIPGK